MDSFYVSEGDINEALEYLRQDMDGEWNEERLKGLLARMIMYGAGFQAPHQLGLRVWATVDEKKKEIFLFVRESRPGRDKMKLISPLRVE
jgi:hypothetical protein